MILAAQHFMLSFRHDAGSTGSPFIPVRSYRHHMAFYSSVVQGVTESHEQIVEVLGVSQVAASDPISIHPSHPPTTIFAYPIG
jgi:hypothetical protein